MKLKLVGGDSAGVVTAYYVSPLTSLFEAFSEIYIYIYQEYHISKVLKGKNNGQMCSENGAGPERDELDIEFLGNRSGEPYLIQTNVYKNGTGGREMRHMLWFDPTEEFHSYSILWNNEQIL